MSITMYSFYCVFDLAHSRLCAQVGVLRTCIAVTTDFATPKSRQQRLRLLWHTHSSFIAGL